MNNSATETSGTRAPSLSPLLLVGLLVGPFMSMMDSSVVNVAVPAIAGGLRIDLAAAQWVISSYLLAFAFGLPVTAFLAKRLGTRPVYTASIAGFTLASLSCALAPSFPALVGLRALQGLCGSPLVPVAGALLFLAPALGPTLGGLLLRSGEWQLIFLINVPIGALGLLGAGGIGSRAGSRGEQTTRFDPLGLATGLAIQPLLTVMLWGLRPSQLPDGTTLFNVTDSLSGALGVALAATLLQERTSERLRQLLSSQVFTASALVGEASMAGLHDTILALALLSALAAVVALFLPGEQKGLAHQVR